MFSCAKAVTGKKDETFAVGYMDVIDQENGPRKKYQACCWYKDTCIPLPHLSSEDHYSVAHGVARGAECFFVVGSSGSHYEREGVFYAASRACMWCVGPHNITHDLGVLPGYSEGEALGVSNTGRVVGRCIKKDSSYQDQCAFVCCMQEGGQIQMMSLRDWLIRNHGLEDELKDWYLRSAHAITPDGLVILGEGIHKEGKVKAFLIKLDS
jgi:hypothetical protein